MKPVVAAALASLLLVPACAQASLPRIAVQQETVELLATHAARESPRTGGRFVAFVRFRRPITDARTVLPVLAATIDTRGRSWLRVRLPGRALGGRPASRTGWITSQNTLRSNTTWHLVVDVSARRVTVYRAGRWLRSYPAIVGKRSTPTPRGEYFVEENVQLPAGHSGAPFALATSARSNVLQEFDGGPGQIALHGRRNIGGQLGTAVSHGCVRLADSSITWLAARIGPGVPVTIR